MSRSLHRVTPGQGPVVYARVIDHSPEDGSGHAEIMDGDEAFGPSVTVVFRTQGRYQVVVVDDGVPALTSEPDRHNVPGAYEPDTKLIVYVGREHDHTLRAKRWAIAPRLWNDVLPLAEIKPYIGSVVADRLIEQGSPGRGYKGTLASCALVGNTLELVLDYPWRCAKDGTPHDSGERQRRFTYPAEGARRVDVPRGLAVNLPALHDGKPTGKVRHLQFGG